MFSQDLPNMRDLFFKNKNRKMAITHCLGKNFQRVPIPVPPKFTKEVYISLNDVNDFLKECGKDLNALDLCGCIRTGDIIGVLQLLVKFCVNLTVLRMPFVNSNGLTNKLPALDKLILKGNGCDMVIKMPR